MDTLATGDVLEVFVTDKGALNDFAAWAQAGGHSILEQQQDGDVITFYIEKA